MEYLEIQKALLKWFKKHKRNLPWRKNRTWYKVWISEIMLQQTQVNQAEEYYKNFIKIFPKNKTLAKSDLQKVLKIWEGLGYYSRARNLHKTAQIIDKQYNGNFPIPLFLGIHPNSPQLGMPYSKRKVQGVHF